MNKKKLEKIKAENEKGLRIWREEFTKHIQNQLETIDIEMMRKGKNLGSAKLEALRRLKQYYQKIQKSQNPSKAYLNEKDNLSECLKILRGNTPIFVAILTGIGILGILLNLGTFLVVTTYSAAAVTSISLNVLMSGSIFGGLIANIAAIITDINGYGSVVFQDNEMQIPAKYIKELEQSIEKINNNISQLSSMEIELVTYPDSQQEIKSRLHKNRENDNEQNTLTLE